MNGPSNPPAAVRPGQPRSPRARRRLAELRSRGGLLPVCSWCKSVRGEAGFWAPAEPGLLEEAGVPLTHGVCPECARNHFPRRGAAA